MTALISFVSEVTPDKKLQKTLIYRYYPSLLMKQQIMQDVREHLKCELEDYVVDLKVEISLKMYDNEHLWYDKEIKPNNDTPNT